MDTRFAAPSLPVTLRVCRMLVWLEATVVVLGGAFVALTATLFGSSEAIPFHDGALSGTGALTLGAVYIVAGLGLAWLGFALGQRLPWSLPAIVSMQVFLAVLELLRSFDVSPSSLFDIALYVAIVALLFAPDTRRALAGGAPS